MTEPIKPAHRWPWRSSGDARPAERAAAPCALALRAVLSVAAVLALATAVPVVTSEALAQGFRWPWEVETSRPPPPQREPSFRAPPREQPPPAIREPMDGGWSGRSSICLELEQRLVQETQQGGGQRERLAQLDAEIRRVDREFNVGQSRLDRADCYEYFLFSKTLRRSRQCLTLSQQVEDARRLLADLQAERQEIDQRSGRSYQDEIIRELARNGCGPGYEQEARRRSRGPFSPFWQDDESGGSGYANSYNALPFATYRTLCVRLCDGYYFPVSFSTLPNHFQRDAEVCQSKCAAPAELYFHQNPGAGVEQMVSFNTNEPYTNLDTAFRYRKQYIDGCSCKETEYSELPREQQPEPADGSRGRAAFSPKR